MTKEDINRINSQYLNDCENTWEMEEIFALALEAVEQEPIIDKIRAEIEQLPTTKCTETCRIYIDADDFKENVLAILDKYKGESENV